MTLSDYFIKLNESGLNDDVLELFKERYSKDVSLPPATVANTIESYKEDLKKIRKTHFPIEFICKNFSNRIAGKKVLIVGLGLSCGYVYDFFANGADVYGVEPDERYLAIQKKHAALIEVNPDHMTSDKAEVLPYPDHSFDFVFCYTVLEHVQDVKKALNEMHRVLKKDGILYIETPDYRIPQEPHYKVMFPIYIPVFNFLYTKLPASIRKIIIKISLTILRRDTQFLKSINFLDERMLKKIFYANGWNFLQMHFPPNIKYPRHILTQSLMKLGITRNIWFFVIK
jgi:ubiquinone/menaquinone biosynthesis C-methylase UbiE